MTEAEWISSTEPAVMLNFLRKIGALSVRKARLFLVSCCRGIPDRLLDDQDRRAIRVAEEFADGRATVTQLEAMRKGIG